VGVNELVMDEASPKEILRVDPELERAQVERVQTLRARRDRPRAEKALAELESAAQGSENLVPRILAAVQALCTVGEIADAMRRVFGEYRPQ
jgi:methylmalonyl-CoA mutase N-terminal domain/subunit